MSTLTFKLLITQNSTALYGSNEPVSDPTNRSQLYYFAFLDQGATAPDAPGLSDFFDNATISTGAFVFVEGQQPAPQDLFEALGKALTISGRVYPRMAWWQVGDPCLTIDYTNQAVSDSCALPFGRWTVVVGQGSQFSPGDGDQLFINQASGDNPSLQVQTVSGGSTQQQGSKPAQIVVPLSGPGTGGLVFDWQWQQRQLQAQFGGELRLFFGAANTPSGANATLVRYPLLSPPPKPSPRPIPDLSFKVTVHPMAPLDGGRTRLALAPPDGSSQVVNNVTGIFMRTPTGATVTLNPVADGTLATGAGFGFAVTAAAGQTDFYLTPVGTFQVVKVADQPGVQVMAGTSGSEFVLAEPGDLLVFQNNHPAWSPDFDPKTTQLGTLNAALTTSWVQVVKAPSAPPAGDGVVTTSYCAQASGATYFARHAGQAATDYPVAVGISLSQLTSLPPGQSCPFFPFLPHGGVFSADPLNSGSSYNPDIEASVVGALESQVTEPARRSKLEPVFNQKYGPIFFDAANNTAFQGGSARTPMGFIAELNDSGGAAPAGTWKTLQLAQSPQNPAQFLELTANADGVVNPRFSNAVLRDNLFMVVTDPSLLWPAGSSGNEVQLGDFTFQVNIGPYDATKDQDQPRAMAIFKMVSGVSFVDMVTAPDRWTSFFGGQDDAAKVQATIQGYLKQAAGGDPLYAAFESIVNDPNWTGVLFFNCPLDYAKLPSDIQILLGGIDGTLRAHHFGVTINRIQDDVTGALAIQSSSLFAVIDYQKAFAAPVSYPAFQVLLFKVEYENSKLVVFNSRIAFSINTLFGNPAALTIAPDAPAGDLEDGDHKATGTIVIDGAYTLHADGTGSLVFATHADRLFTFPANAGIQRVLTAQSVSNAALVPVTSVVNSDQSVTATAAFRLDGCLVFVSDVAGDLFSYGTSPPASGDTVVMPTDGLIVLGYAFSMVTQIPATEGPAKLAPITTDLSGLKVDQGLSKARAGSFKSTFPSRIDSVTYVSAGRGTTQLGAWQVALDGDPTTNNAAPTYMLGFKIPMGNLGGLVSATDIVADLYVGWVPGGAAAQADKVGAVLVLPASVSGPDGFKVQGIIPATFDSVYLDQVTMDSSKSGEDVTAYVLRFQHYSGKLVGIPLSYDFTGPLHEENGPKDLGIFGSPNVLSSDPSGDNCMWYVGKSEDLKAWKKGPQFDLVLFEDLPTVFLGRSFAIKTDPTNPDVIDDAVDELNQFAAKTVADFMKELYAESGLYDSSAGMTFAFKFEVLALSFAILLHDNDFYGAKVALKLEEEKKPKPQPAGGGGGDDPPAIEGGGNDPPAIEGGASGQPQISGGGARTRARVGDPPPAGWNPYDVLGVDKNATQQQIDSAKRQAYRKYHPDKNDDPDAREKFDEVTRAYDAVGTPEARAKYDADPDAAGKAEETKMIEDKKKKGLGKFKGFEFSILYRKVSDHLGVFSATIYVDMGKIEVGVGKLTLPDFTVSIWTNGDWRFSVGWPLSGHPIGLEFMLGPVPVTGKLGFYLAKLRSEDAPDTLQMQPADSYPPNFKLIWSFGLGISAGVGKKWESGPLEASASLSLVLTVQGFLASFSGSITDDGIDYYWWAISLGLVGQVKGKVDFKIISAELSISLSLTVSLALESYHSTALELTFNAKVTASVKIIFVTVHFSFSTSLTLAKQTFGSGPDASMSGPNPKEVQNQLPKPTAPVVPLAAPVMRSRSLVAREARRTVSPVLEAMMAAPVEAALAGAQVTDDAGASPVAVPLRFVLQSTATSSDGTSWAPQGVATLVIENGDTTSPFGLLASGIATWLVSQFGDYPGSPDYLGDDTFAKQLNNIAAALADGQFDTLVDTCLGAQFRFSISGYDTAPTNPPPVAVFPMHPCLGLSYKEVVTPLGQPLVPASYAATVQAYFEPGSASDATNDAGQQSVTGLVFTDYILMLAKQLVADLQQAAGDSLADSLTPAVLSNVGGFVSRFLLGGARLPDPQNAQTLKGLYELTSQQFRLDPAVLNASLSIVPNVTLQPYLPGPVSATAVLQKSQVLNVAPKARAWTAAAMQPLAPLPVRYPMNTSVQWRDSGVTNNIYMFADGVRAGIEQWKGDNPGADGPWLSFQQVSGSTPQTATTQPYAASGAVVLPLSIQTIPQPGGAAGTVLPDIFSLVGTDEVHRAYLQALLDDPAVDILSLHLAISTGQGQYQSLALPGVLVRADLSTSAAPAGGGGLRSMMAMAAVRGVANDYCANYAWPQQGADEFGKFLRLVWECSIVHTGGFYLRLAGLTDDQLASGSVSLRLIVGVSPSAQVIKAPPYVNAVVGAPPAAGAAVIGSLMADSAGATPVVNYSAAYPGGNTGWTLQWATPPVAVDAGTDQPDAVLSGLYQMVSYRITKVDGSPVSCPWSRPVTGLTLSDSSPAWTYQSSFPTGTLLGPDQGRYAAVGKQVRVEISVEDIFGNSMPGESVPLTVVYNDELMGLARWSGTQSSYQVQPSAQAGKAAFSVNLSYGSIPFSLGDFADVAAFAAVITAKADAVSALVFSRFPAEVQATLNDSTSTPSAVQIALITGLNSLVQASTCVYDANAFAAVVLRPQTKDLLAQAPTGIPLTFLNRLLLEDAYPAAILPEIADTNDLTTLQQALSDYQTISSQLQDTRVSAEITTGAILAPAGSLTSGVLPALQTYASQVVAWLTWLANGKPAGAVPLVPQPVVIGFQVDQNYPVQWDGDLRELQVGLLLQRSGVLPEIAALAPEVQSVASPVKPVQGLSTAADPTGLAAFALDFELAYNGFDGQLDGVIKVATGMNSDLTSVRFGMQTLWLARWGKTSGMSVQIINSDPEKPVFYAPPPLSTQLITRQVSGLTDYTKNPPVPAAPQVFSSIDMDITAAGFLSAVENIFTPQMAPRVASPSSAPVTYDAYVGAKSSLAQSIANQLASIYVIRADAGDPESARETMRQALLQTLENDYGIAALVQMAVQIGLHGAIEPGATTPPNLYGSFSVNGAPTGGSSPYSLSSAKLPIKDGKGWLNFLFSVQDQALQNAMTLDLDYQMGFIEHHINDAETKCGYTPSEWLTFVLQQNQQGMPQGQDNTLTAPAGSVRIPIPLRSYPPLPKLMLASATQDTDPNKAGGSIADYLTWSYQLNTAVPSARQDTLNIMVTFNEPPTAQTPAALRALAANDALTSDGDLFDALARFSYAYPALQPAIDSVASTSPSLTAPQALAALADMAQAVAAAWPDWTPPAPPTSAPAGNGTTEVWSYAINVQNDGSLQVTSQRNGSTASPPPWPVIAGYITPTSTTGPGIYKLAHPQNVPNLWQFAWQKLYVLDYQSARASAFTERNSNLGTDVGETTNPAFIYRTETVSMPAPSVPLIKALAPVALAASTGLSAAVSAMIAALHGKPGSGQQTPVEDNELKIEGAIYYSFELLSNLGSTVRSYLPLFLLQNDIAPGGDAAAAQQIAANISTWFGKTQPSTTQSAVSFRLTIYATKIATGDEHLPLVQFQSLLISAPDGTPQWWQS